MPCANESTGVIRKNSRRASRCGALAWIVMAGLAAAGCGAAGQQTPKPFVLDCTEPRPDLGALQEVQFALQNDCEPHAGDSVTLEHVYATALPIDVGVGVFVSGTFTLASVPAVDLQLFVDVGEIQGCVGGEAREPGGAFELYGTTQGVIGGPTHTITVDFWYDAGAVECVYLLSQ